MFKLSHFTCLGFEAGLTPHPFSYITLISNSVLATDDILHLYWDDDNFCFEKIQCEKSEDSMEVRLCNYLSDEDGYEVNMLFEKESGSIPLKMLEPFLKKLETLKLPIIYDNSDTIGRDGIRYTFCAGRGYYKSCFSWWNVETPKEWTSLEQLAQHLKDLSAVFKVHKAENYKMTFSRTLEEDGWMEITNKEEIDAW